MSSWAEGRRPITLAILALGGEGGGVLADWIVATAEDAGYHAQNTSVAGVAQRTGATVYYVELLPPDPDAAKAGARGEPVMSIFPTPGEVDVLIASELMEAGRAVQRGFSTADRTTLITSTSRVYSIDEKIAMGDGRVDDTQLVDAAQRASKRLIATDFQALAEQAGSVISASLFGALAGSDALPFARKQFEVSIRTAGKGVEASLAAFAAGFEAARAAAAPSPAPRRSSASLVELPVPSGSASAPVALPVVHSAPTSRTAEDRKEQAETERTAIAATDPTSLVGPGLCDLAERVRDLPGPARSMALHGLVRTAVYQDRAYAQRYLERVARFAAVEPDDEGGARLTLEAARHVALWMCYQDTIQVAHQKVRRARMDRIRDEAHARPDQVVQVREFLHPQAEEITDTLPARLGAALQRSQTFQRVVGKATHRGMILNTNSVLGYGLLTTMARARPLRPRSLRFGREQEAIERWIDRALQAAATDPDLACEIVECQRVLKGYGSTYEHGSESFSLLMDAADTLTGTDRAAARLAGLRDAALADEDGTALQAKVAQLRAT